jgi:hypothetical protein
MAAELENINWESVMLSKSDINETYQDFISTIGNAVLKHVPTKTISSEYQKKRGFSHHIIRAIKKKHKAWQRYMETRSGEKYREYTKKRNKVTKLTRQSQRDFEKELAKEVKNNPKKFWKYVKSKTKTPTGIPELWKDENDEQAGTATEDTEKANVLADFYSTVFTNEPPGETPDLPNRNINPMPLREEISEILVSKLLKGLNPSKSPGPDKLHPRILKELAETLTKPVTMLFNRSLQSGNLPELWKRANVSPIFKKGCRQSASNYRPVSLTCILCKQLESILRTRIIDHMRSNNLLSKRQYGFIAGRSTTLQLLHVIEQWTDILDKGGSIDVSYLDFQKAFDKVPHRRLLSKIENLGITGDTLSWIKDFLTNRKQRVLVNGKESSWRDVTSGIPQGSVLGPLLFVAYINDMPDCVLSPVFLFADDTKIFRQIETIDDHKIFQDDLDNLVTWSNRWLLCFHPAKCKVMTIGEDGDYAYTMTGPDGRTTELLRTRSEKDVGVTFDPELRFEDDMNNRIMKASSIMGVIRRTYSFLDSKSFKYLFIALVRPHVEYGAPIWQPKLKKNIAALESVQRRATRQIQGFKNLEYEERLAALDLPSLRFRRLRGDMIEAYKILSGKYDDSLEHPLHLAQSHTRGHSLKLVKPRATTSIRANVFSHRIVNNWNSLPEEVVTADSINSFKNRLDKHWKNHPMKFNWKADSGPTQFRM